MIRKLLIFLTVAMFSVLALSEKLMDINVSDNDREIIISMTFDKVPVFKTEEDLSKTVFSVILPDLHLSYMYLPVHLGPLESVRFIDLEKETYVTFYTLLPLKPEVFTKRNSIYVKFKKIPKRINLSFESGMSLANVIKYLSEYIDVNVVISNEVSKLSVPSIKLHNVSPEDAFRVILISVPGVAYSYFPDGTLYVGKAGGDITEKFNKFWGIYRVSSSLTSQQIPSFGEGTMPVNKTTTLQPSSFGQSIEHFSEIYPGAVVEYLKRKSVILVYGGPAIHSKIVELLSGKKGFEVVKVKNPAEASRILSEMFNASVTYMKPDKVVLKGDLAMISKMKDALNRLGLIGSKVEQENLYKTIEVEIPKENQGDFQSALKETEDFVKSTIKPKEVSITYYPSLKKVVVISDSKQAIESALEIINKLKEKYKMIPKKEEKAKKVEEVEKTKKTEEPQNKEEKKKEKVYTETLSVSQKINPKVIDEIKDYVSKDEGATVTVYYYPDIGRLLIEAATKTAIEKVKDILNAYMMSEKELLPSSTETSVKPSTPETHTEEKEMVTPKSSETEKEISSSTETTFSSATTHEAITTFSELGEETEPATMITYDVTGEFDYKEFVSLVSKIYPDLKIFPLKNTKKIVFIGKEKSIKKAIDISTLFERGKYSIKLINYSPSLPIESVLSNISDRFPTLKIIVIKSKNYMIVSGSEEEISSLKSIILDLESQLSKIPTPPSTFTEKKPATETSEVTPSKKIVTVSATRISIDAPGVSLGEITREVFKALGKSIVFVNYPEDTVYLNVSGITLDKFKSILELYGYELTSLDNSFVLEKKKESETSEGPVKEGTKTTLPEEKKVLIFDNISHNFKKVEEFVKYFGGQVFIDEVSGLSIVTGIEDENVLKTISSYISKISVKPKQIEIEVRLVDEILSKNNNLTTTTNLGIPMTGGRISLSPNGLEFTTDILNASQYENYLKSLLNSQVSITHSPGQSSGNSKILAAPRVITTSGEKARIFIGDKEIYVLPNGTPLTQNYGVELTITPTYRPDGTVELDINVKVSNSAPAAKGQEGQRPLASERSREANTKVIIKDGQTIVIGGLMREITEKMENKLPFLGDLPIIGYLFRSVNETSEKRNLIIFITARVVTGW